MYGGDILTLVRGIFFIALQAIAFRFAPRIAESVEKRNFPRNGHRVKKFVELLKPKLSKKQS